MAKLKSRWSSLVGWSTDSLQQCQTKLPHSLCRCDYQWTRYGPVSLAHCLEHGDRTLPLRSKRLKEADGRTPQTGPARREMCRGRGYYRKRGSNGTVWPHKDEPGAGPPYASCLLEDGSLGSSSQGFNFGGSTVEVHHYVVGAMGHECLLVILVVKAGA